MFRLEFSTDNAAFEGDFAPEEIARILRDAADRVASNIPMTGGDSGGVYDANGNRIGSWSYEPSEDGEG